MPGDDATVARALTFDGFERPAWRHLFFLRSPQEEPVEAKLRASGWPTGGVVQAEQIHDCGVAVVDAGHAGQCLGGADALITRDPSVVLAIRVADCGPVYLGDPLTGSIGLIHSGRKGTERNILGETVARMREAFGVEPSRLIGQLGPCIRPPHYEVDFAADIRRQAREAGIGLFHDCGLNTADDLGRFYSYRIEKGRTGRHWAVLALSTPDGR